jgi:hypothetical protein
MHVYTKNVLHLDNTTTSRDEGAHSMIKRDLEVSTNNFLTGPRSMERTLTHQHRKVIDEIEQEKVSISVSHRIPLFREVIAKISSTALAKTLTLRNNYLPVGAPGRREIEPCTGVTTKTVGIPVFMKFARCLKANDPSLLHTSTATGIYAQHRKLLQLTHDYLC